MRVTLTLAFVAACVSSCSSPPGLPSIDGTHRRPVNTGPAIELQRCAAELSAARLALAEAAHRATRATATAEARVAQAQAAERETCQALLEERRTVGNRVYVIPFAVGSTTLRIDGGDLAQLLASTRDAPLVIVRGRTDGADTSAETALARRRAHATAELLVRAGLPRERLRLQWQGGAGPDHDGPAGVGDRRAEIEVYGARPERTALLNQAQ